MPFFIVEDMSETISFYTEKLGFKITAIPQDVVRLPFGQG